MTKRSQYSDIANRFKEIRLKHNYTQKEFAKLVGLSAPAIGAIENGRYTPNFNVLRTIKSRLNVDYSFLIDGEDDGDIKKLRQDNLKLKKEVDRLAKVIDKLVKD
jgi:transcriptional regulator with XRE-family HTH domain